MRIPITLFVFLSAQIATAQSDTLKLQNAIGRLQLLGDTVMKGSSDSIRLAANLEFSSLLDSILHTNAGTFLSFYNVKGISVARSSDKKIKLLTWMLEDRGRSQYSFYGYLIYKPDKHPTADIIRLKQGAYTSREELETRKSSNDDWTGCIYYSIINERKKKKDHYMLLGWAPQSADIHRKIAEPLIFQKNKINFGAPLIRNGSKIQHRLILDYNARAVVSLRYNQDLKMIVMDHLSPSENRPEAKGMYQLYGPDFSYDGLDFVNGKWVVIKDIDVRLR